MGFSVLLDVINFYLLSHASITARLFTFPRTTSRDLLHHHMKSYTELHYKADARRPTVLLSRGRKSFVAFRRVIVHYVRRSTLLIRKSTLIAEKCSELRRSLWIRVFSCRRRTFNVRRRSEVNCGVESSSVSSAERHPITRSTASAACLLHVLMSKKCYITRFVFWRLLVSG